MSGVAEKLEDLQNIDTAMAERLRKVAIATPKKLAEIGAVDAYCMLKITFPDTTSAGTLIAIQGALMGVPQGEVPIPLCDELKREAWDTLRVHKKLSK